jgi:uncharacterized membrane protein YqiK
MTAIDTQTLDTSELDTFTNTLRKLAHDDIRAHARHVQAVADDLDWWQTTIAVDQRLRNIHMSRRAAAAARAARDAVLATVAADDRNQPEVIAVSRAAADAARALVAGCHITDIQSFAVGCVSRTTTV